MDRTEPARHSVSVAAVIVNDAEQLLAIQRRDNGHWEPPGGVLELNEGIEDGLRREVREETGVDVAIEALTGAYKNLMRGIVALVFRCRIVGGELTTSEETTQIRWIDPDHVGEMMDEAFAIRMFDALEAGPPRIRSHNGVSLLA